MRPRRPGLAEDHHVAGDHHYHGQSDRDLPHRAVPPEPAQADEQCLAQQQEEPRCKRRGVDVHDRLRAGGDPNATLSSEFDLLRYEHRFAELRARLGAASSEFAQHSPLGARVGASLKPVAELRGWERLLAGDPDDAAREGKTLAIFGERLPKSAGSEWWRRLLAGESALMLGEQARAIDEARAAMRLVADGPTFPVSLHVRLMAARVLAWAGEDNEALALLETLARGYPGVGPATIVRDPFFGSARLQSTARCERFRSRPHVGESEKSRESVAVPKSRIDFGRERKPQPIRQFLLACADSHFALLSSSHGIGSHSSTLFPSGSRIHANFPFSWDSGPFMISTPFRCNSANISAMLSIR